MSNPEIISTNDDETLLIEESDNRSGAPEDTFTVPDVTRKMVNDNSQSQHQCQDKQQYQPDRHLNVAEVPADQIMDNKSIGEMVYGNSKQQHPCQAKEKLPSDRYLSLEGDQIMDDKFSCIESNETSNDIFIPPMSRDSYNKQSCRRTPNLTPPSFHTNISTGGRVYYSQTQEVSFIQLIQLF